MAGRRGNLIFSASSSLGRKFISSERGETRGEEDVTIMTRQDGQTKKAA